MLQPKRVKYRRPQDGRGNKGNAHRGTQLAFGTFGIKTLEAKWIDSRQIEAARVAVNRYMQREGQVWIRIFPDKPITRKPADVRMGKGKGDPAGWVAPVTPGRILFEVEGVSFDIAKEALRLAARPFFLGLSSFRSRQLRSGRVPFRIPAVLEVLTSPIIFRFKAG